MSHIRDMYCMVRAVKKDARRMDKQETMPVRENGHEVWWSAQDNVKRRFLKYRKYWSWTVSEAEEVLMDCCTKKYGYLTQGTISTDGTFSLLSGNSKCDVVKLSTKGRKLMGRRFSIFPTGLWYAWYKEDGKAFIAISGLVITTLLTIAGLLAKIAFSGHGVTIDLYQITRTDQIQSQTQSPPASHPTLK